MSTRSTIASALASVGVLLAGWQAGTAHGQTATAISAPTTTTTSTATTLVVAAPATTSVSTASSSSTGTTGTTIATATASGWKSGTYTGTTATNRYGSVTVRVTIADGRITDVQATTVARDNHSARINSAATPTLRSEVLAAQGAGISTVSGATYTSDSYATSLQAALDQAAS